MLIAIVPLIAAIIGLLMYALSASEKVVKIGFVLFWTGTLVTLLTVAGNTVKLL